MNAAHEAVAKLRSDPAGPDVVDHAGEDAWVPKQHQHLPALFARTVEEGVRGAVPNGGRGSFRKKVLKLDLPSGPHRTLVKPYFEKIPPRLVERYGADPHTGWAEVSSQALYHAAKIGHLHQRVHTAWVPGEDGASKPVVAIHLEPGATTVADADWGTLGRTAQQRLHVRQLALMDFLKGYPDRNYINLCLTRGGHLLSIDHALCFRYRTPMRLHTQEDDRSDSVADYHRASALDLVDPLEQPLKDRAEVERQAHRSYDAALNWWQRVSPRVKRVFRDRLALVKDPALRSHIEANFMARARHLDALSRGEGTIYDRVPLLTTGEPI